MTAKPVKQPNLKVMFPDAYASLQGAEVDASHLTEGPKAATLSTSKGIDLAGKTKCVMFIGPGRVGKTTFLRWIAERAGENERDMAMATADPVNRDLMRYFPDTVAPPSPALSMGWLEQLFEWQITNKVSAGVDFGGGNPLLVDMVRQIPTLATDLTERGLEPVLFHILSPRSADLTQLVALEQLGFQPRATAVVPNLGLADEAEFGAIRRQEVYRKVLDRGGVEILMPRLHSAQRIDFLGLGFHAGSRVPEPGTDPKRVLGPFDRSRTQAWLHAMEAATAPVSTWLP